MQRTTEILQGAQVEAQQVPLKLLLPIIENATLEQDDDLQDIWANLLANAATPQQTNPIAPPFPAILKELTARDVKFLDALFLEACKMRGKSDQVKEVEDVRFNDADLSRIFSLSGLARFPATQSLIPMSWHEYRAELEADKRDMTLSMDVFKRHGIVVLALESPVKEGTANVHKLGIKHSLSHLGNCFVRACRDPNSPTP